MELLQDAKIVQEYLIALQGPVLEVSAARRGHAFFAESASVLSTEPDSRQLQRHHRGMLDATE